jgi:gliding motility-associated-like protein
MTPVDECLTGVQVCDSVSWIITHQSNTDKFYCYQLTQNGLIILPIINSIGQSFILSSSCAKFSVSGQKFAISYGGVVPFLELFDFDTNTGQLSSIKNLTANGGEYSIEFSVNEKYLYVASNGNLLHQFDISSNIETVINGSYTLIYDSFDNSSFLTIQNSMDSKMYISAIRDSISVINNPDNPGLSCNLNYLSVYLNGKYSQLGLPNFSTNYFDTKTLESCSETIYVPNVFTPNNDGINDYFSIQAVNYFEISYQIYNRWGNEIVNSTNNKIINSKITLWDGKTKGVIASDGVYYYVINLKKTGGEMKTEKGFVQLFH